MLWPNYSVFVTTNVTANANDRDLQEELLSHSLHDLGQSHNRLMKRAMWFDQVTAVVLDTALHDLGQSHNRLMKRAMWFDQVTAVVLDTGDRIPIDIISIDDPIPSHGLILQCKIQ
eukprot:CAMPEP_0194445430 /NCGR_PEP_ID=MMETSP0176-20130528/127857_1 /TAXON_ID=216777 /ORGANISM="Proboscia alata, Strain PI-D3" /LENGTH=115 /DNA_ID=CAMNT_0039271989 /DNA_START=244 /DNA_END=592 /DNA_ORIENTATION=+